VEREPVKGEERRERREGEGDDDLPACTSHGENM
jgi:hypothetical protein